MKKIVFTLCALLSLCHSSYAATWLDFFESNEDIAAIDTDSVTTQGYITTAWVKFIVHHDLTTDGLTVGDNLQMLYYTHCSDRTFTVMQGVGYKKDGSYVASFEEDAPKYTEIIPGTVNEAIYWMVCEGKYPPKVETTTGLKALEDIHNQ